MCGVTFPDPITSLDSRDAVFPCSSHSYQDALPKMKWFRFIARLLTGASAASRKNLIVDTDLFSDVE